MRFASVLSVAETTADAAADVCEQVMTQLPEGADLAIVFSTAHHVEGLIQVSRVLREVLGCRVVLAGGSCGVAGQGREAERGPALSVLAGVLPDAGLNLFCIDHIGNETSPGAAEFGESGEERPAPLACDSNDVAQMRTEIGIGPLAEPPRLIILLADPFSTPLVRLLPSLQAAYPGTPVIGGRICCSRKPGANRMVLNDTEFSSGAIGLAISGQIEVTTTVSAAARPIGEPVVITRSMRQIVQELGGRPAYDYLLSLYHSLNESDQLALRQGDLLAGRVLEAQKKHLGAGDYILQRVCDVDEATGYIAIDDHALRAGQTLQFHLRDPGMASIDLTRLLDAQRLHGPGAAGLVFLSRHRGASLFGSLDHDLDAIDRALPGLPVAGAFVDGEIGPVYGHSHVHRHAAVLAVIRPREPDPNQTEEPD